RSGDHHRVRLRPDPRHVRRRAEPSPRAGRQGRRAGRHHAGRRGGPGVRGLLGGAGRASEPGAAHVARPAGCAARGFDGGRLSRPGRAYRTGAGRHHPAHRRCDLRRRGRAVRAAAGDRPAGRLGTARGGQVPADDDGGELDDRGQAGGALTVGPGLVWPAVRVRRGRARRRCLGAGSQRCMTGENSGMTGFRRARRELIYSLLGSLAGVAGFFLVAFTMLPGLALSVTAVFTVFGLTLVMFSLSLAVRMGSLHRLLLARFLGDQVPPPAAFLPGTGLLNRVDKRLRYKPGWRAVLFALIKAPVAAVQGFSVGCVIDGVIDVSYPLIWPLFRNHKPGTHLSPLHTLSPVPPAYAVSSWPETLVAALIGIVYVAVGVVLSRAINSGDRRLIRTLLGPNRLDERVTQLERTRALAVEDAAAALRRVERDLHDGAQMRLAALAMNLGMAQEKLDEAD